MRPEQKSEYREYVAARWTAMRNFAYLTCGDWHRAEDATQTAFIKLYAAWNRASRASLDAYTRRIIVNGLIDEHRRGWFRRERPHDELPNLPGPELDSPQRITVLETLAALPPRQRATIVLRFWEDQSVQETAKTLKCSVNTVKTQTARGLQTLRGLLAETINEQLEGNLR